MFPAIFDWGRFSDFAAQLKDAARVRMGEASGEGERITAGSTFKPKSLRNRAKVRCISSATD